MEDRIIQALQPRIAELDQRLLAGEALSSEDINTLLLQHQFNHIYHLELRNEALDARMDKQDARMDKQDARMDQQSMRMNEQDERMNRFEISLIKLGTDLRLEMHELRLELKLEMSELRVQIEKTVNRTMLFYIGAMTFVITGLGLLDRLFPR